MRYVFINIYILHTVKYKKIKVHTEMFRSELHIAFKTGSGPNA